MSDLNLDHTRFNAEVTHGPLPERRRVVAAGESGHAARVLPWAGDRRRARVDAAAPGGWAAVSRYAWLVGEAALILFFAWLTLVALFAIGGEL